MTLLSKAERIGPHYAWNGNEDNIKGEADIFLAFANYKDPDGYVFLCEYWKCSEEKTLDWGYYPPENFKILLYYPQSGMFVTSGEYEKYAFDSYYKVDMSMISGTAAGTIQTIQAIKNYNYTWELVSLAVRIAATVLIEILIALLFGLDKKKLLPLIVYVNLITQVLLNVILNILNFKMGFFAFVFYYILLEIVVVIIEAAAYLTLFPKRMNGSISRLKTVLYAITANTASFAAGFVLAAYIPGIL